MKLQRLHKLGSNRLLWAIAAIWTVITVGIAHSDPASAAEDDGLIAYYEFDEAQGDLIPDLSGNKRNARLAGGAKLAEGKFGKAVELNGQGAYVQLPEKIVAGDQFTFSGWTYWNGGARAQRIFDFGTDSDGPYVMMTPKGVGDAVRMLVRGNNPADAVAGKSAFPEKVWAHAAVVMNGSRVSIYVNGELVASKDDLANTASQTAGPNNHLGKSKYANEPFFGGKFDRIAIYAKALGESDIKALAGGRAPADPAKQTPVKQQPADLNAQFDSLKQQGIFQGYADGSARLDKEMTRAEFAAVLVRLLKLQPATGHPSYTDTESHWAHQDGYIEAVTEAKVMEGISPGTFNPDGPITVEQTAAVLVRALKLDTAAGSTVQGQASEWAKPYIEAALKAGLLQETADYTVNAKRELLVYATYASQHVAFTGKLAVVGVKATGASRLTVQFNGAVPDASKLTFSVTKDGNEMKLTGRTIWSDDGRSVGLAFAQPMSPGSYVVRVSGADIRDPAQASGHAKVEAEKVSSIAFAANTETLSQSTVLLEFHALNQYGEAMDLNASHFAVSTNLGDGDAEIRNELRAVKLKLDAKTSSGGKKYAAGFRPSITIVHEASGVSANKTFVVGEAPLLSKFELGDVMNQSGAVAASAETGRPSFLAVKVYDQYGMRMSDKQLLNERVSAFSDNGYMTYAQPFEEDVDNDEWPDFRFYVGDQARSGEMSLTLFGDAAKETAKVKVLAAVRPSSVEFGKFQFSLAEGDGDDKVTNSALASYKKFIPIVMKNGDGVQLSEDEIAAAAGIDFIITVSGGAFQKSGSYPEGIVNWGPYKGYLQLENVKEGDATITIQLKQNPEVKASMTLHANKPRKAQSIRLTKNEWNKAAVIDGQEGVSLVRFQLFDQYNIAANAAAVFDAKYAVRMTFVPTSSAADAVVTQLPPNVWSAPGASPLPAAPSASYYGATIANSLPVNQSAMFKPSAIFDKELLLKGKQFGTYVLRAELLELDDAGNWKALDSAVKNFEVIDITNESVEFKPRVVRPVERNGRYVAQDLHTYDNYFNKTAVQLAGGSPDHRKAGKKIMIDGFIGKERIALPGSVISAVYSSNSRVADAALGGDGVWVFGGHEGDADIAVMYKTPKGQSAVSVPFTVVDQRLSADELTAVRRIRIARASEITSGVAKLYEGPIFGDLRAFDKTAGNEFLNGDIGTFTDLIGVSYIVTEKGEDSPDLTIGSDGTMTFAAPIKTITKPAYYTIKMIGFGPEITLKLGITPTPAAN